MKTITSRQNQIVARFRVAARTRRPASKHILLDGTNLINDAHAAGINLELAVFSTEKLRRHDLTATRLADVLERDGVEVMAASESVLTAISPVRSPSGAVAIASHQRPSMEHVFESCGLIVTLVGVQDPGNVGAIIRASDAGSASGVIVSSQSADPFGWKALRGAMGSTFRLPVVDVDDVRIAVNFARARGISVVAAVPWGGTSIYETNLARPLLLLLGAEGSGLADELTSELDDRVTIPMRQSVESLNTAVAAALIVYEARRQRDIHSHQTG